MQANDFKPFAKPYAISYDEFPEDPETIEELEAAGLQISRAINAVHGKTYIYGQSREILGLAAGTSKDYM